MAATGKEYNIKVVADFDKNKSNTNIDKALQNFSNQNKKISINAELNTADLQKKINSAMGQLSSSKGSLGFNLDTSKIDNAKNKFDSLKNTFNQISQNKMADIWKNTSKNIDLTTNSIEKSSKATKSQIDANNKVSYSWSKAWEGAIKYSLVMGSLVEVKRIIEDMVGSVIELDDSLLELRKVTDLEGESLEKFTKKAFEAGESLARTGQEVIDATTAFAKSGYDENESLGLGKVALMYQNIADEEINAGDSADFIIAQLKAFNLEATDTNKTLENSYHIIDAVNEVSNNFAVSSADIAENLGKSSSVMANAGNTLEETIGLLTAGTEITRNASRVSNGLKTITLRLQGMNDEGTKDLKLQANMEKLFNKLGISVYDANGKLKTTYDILKTLAPVYQKATAEQKSYITEQIAGKYQAQNAAAILQNFKTAISATETAMNSAGSASKENEKYLDSISGKIQQFKSQFQELANNLINSKFVKNITDLGTSLLKFANTDLGQIAVKVTLATLSLVAFNTILNKIKKSAYGQAFADLGENVKGFITSGESLTSRVKGLGSSFKMVKGEASSFIKMLISNWPLALIVGGTVAVIALGKALEDVSTITEKEYKKSKKDYEDSISQLEDKKKKYNELKDKIKNLDNLGDKRTKIEDANLVKYKEQLEVLKKQLKELEKQTKERKKSFENTAKEKAAQDGSYSRKANVTVESANSSPTKDFYGPQNSNYGLSLGSKGNSFSRESKNSNQFSSNLPSYVEKNNIVTNYEDDVKNLENLTKLMNSYTLSTKEEKDVLTEISNIKSSLINYGNVLLKNSQMEGLSEKEQLNYLSQYVSLQNKLGNSSAGFKAILNDDNIIKATKTTGKLSNQTKTFGDALKDATSDGKLTSKEVENLRTRYEAFNNVMKESKTSNKDAAEGLLSYANSAEYAQSKVQSLSSIIDSVTTTLGGYASNVDYLTGAVDEFNDSGYITAETLKNLSDNNLIEYLNFTGSQLTANTNALYDNAESTKYKALMDLQAAFNADALSIAEGNVSDASDLAKTAVANAASDFQRTGTIAAASAGGLFTYAAGLESIENKGKKIDTKKKEAELKELSKIYTKYGQAIVSTGVGESKKKSSSYSGSGSKGSSSSKSEKEWWEKELDNLKTEFDYNNLTIDEYIGSLSNLLGRLQQGTEAWKKINEELQKQRLSKIENDYKRGSIGVKEYISQLRNLQNAYKAGSEAWNDLADKIKSGLKELLSKQKETYETAHDATMKIIDDEIDKINEQRDATEKYYDKLIEDKQKANEETSKEIELAKLQEALYNAQNEKTKRVFREGIGWVYETDKTAIDEAKTDLSDFMNEQEINDLEDAKDKALAVFDEQLDAWDKYKNSWDEVVDDYESQQARLTLSQTLGSDAEAKILQQRLDVLERFKNEYNSTLSQIDALENTSSVNTGAINNIQSNIRGYSNGIENGVVDYTGYAKLHGSPSNPEYVLNNGQMKNLLVSLTRPGYINKSFERGNSNTYNFGNIELPNVQHANQFLSELKSVINVTKHQ